jgi:hypothetical protein
MSAGGSLKASMSLTDSFDFFNCSTLTSPEKREHEHGNPTNQETMPHEVAYFDSQASAAAALNISIEEIRRAKRAGCPAFRSGRVYKKRASEMARGKQTEGNETAGKARRGICELHSKDCLHTIRARTGSGSFCSIVFSHEAIRRRPDFDRGIFRALHGDNCASPTRISLKCWKSG